MNRIRMVDSSQLHKVVWIIETSEYFEKQNPGKSGMEYPFIGIIVSEKKVGRYKELADVKNTKAVISQAEQSSIRALGNKQEIRKREKL